jgi:hypothetical protein
MASRKALPRFSIASALSFLAAAGSSQPLPPGHQIPQIFQRYREAFVGQSVLRLSRVNLP